MMQVSFGSRVPDDVLCALHAYMLTRFNGLVLSGHPGVPNATLVKEDDPWNSKYGGKSLAEQNSGECQNLMTSTMSGCCQLTFLWTYNMPHLQVDLCWGELMRPEYTEFRAAIYSTEYELKHFRQLVVNVRTVKLLLVLITLI
jgi:hypothetical protein